MVKIIVGPKGHSKTNRLIDAVNAAVESSKGSVICIEKGSVSTFMISSSARLVDIDEYDVTSYDNLYSFICGMLASNYDITDLFVDSTLRIGGRDYDALDAFLAKVSALSAKCGVNFMFTVSTEADCLKPSTYATCSVQAV